METRLEQARKQIAKTDLAMLTRHLESPTKKVVSQMVESIAASLVAERIWVNDRTKPDKYLELSKHFKLAKLLGEARSMDDFKKKVRKVFAGTSYAKAPTKLLTLGGLPWKVQFDTASVRSTKGSDKTTAVTTKKATVKKVSTRNVVKTTAPATPEQNPTVQQRIDEMQRAIDSILVRLQPDEPAASETVIAVKAVEEPAVATDLDQYIAAFDEELRERTSQLDRAQAEIKRLKAEIIRLQEPRETPEGDLLVRGDEGDLYPNEIVDCLLDVLEREIRGTSPRSRKHDILQSILLTNTRTGLPARDVRETLKGVFRGYTRWTPQIQADLQKLGFVIAEDTNKHIKLRYHGDPRYTLTLSCTPSDRRAGVNCAGDAIRLLY